MTEAVDNTEQILDVRKVVILRLDRRIVVAIGTCFLSCLLMCAVTFAFAVHVARQQGQDFCDLLGTYDQVYREHPPTTETGRTLAQQVHDLVARLECANS